MLRYTLTRLTLALITAPLLAQERPVSRPAKDTSTLLPTFHPPDPGHLRLTIGPDQSIYFDGRCINLEEVQKTFAELNRTTEGPLPPLVVRCNHGVKSALLIKVLDGARAAGATKISLSSAPTSTKTTPFALHQPAPKLPKELQKDAARAAVTVRFVVDEKGRPQAARVSKSNDHRFDKPALEAVLSWRFAPVTKKGKPVVQEVRQLIRFVRPKSRQERPDKGVKRTKAK